ncbi:LacI family DNA-binding transcriptional regulator [Streptomyces hoynatensis]|uniref:LacI family transcriptional regulator n=1 Tax=Streptomyces hoynatensis TaxID=1141874 RepID=A0A3A9YYN7_9ACTN|nr:LacI family DNA-binding transcriptional regulator [Streptomyces hoynatensis]RKN41191.1 LacI family transcriptional regulator [Streptomyces hoynatensis]
MASSERRRRPTQVDIARRAGVSQATVSLVISGGAASDQIAEATRRAVLTAAEELGYSANVAARSLKGGRNHLLGLYTFEPVFPTDQRDFYYPFLLGVEEETAAQGYDLLLFSSVTSAADRSIYAGGANRLKLADGCVLLGRHVRREELTALVKEDFPFVFIGRREVEGGEISYVAADYVSATAQMVARLAALGHRRILYLRAAQNSEPTQDRTAGYRRGLAEAGLPFDSALIRTLDDPAEVTGARVREWIGSGVTALLAEPTEDDRLVAALAAVDRSGLVRFPEDCSLALLGDPPLWTGESRDWTRFSLPRVGMAREAVRLLVELLAQPAHTARRLSVPCEFVPGDSIGPAPAGRGPEWSA